MGPRSNTDELRFFHYPEVREGPSVPYKNEDQSIPVLRGAPLAIGASLYACLHSFIPSPRNPSQHHTNASRRIHNVGFIQSFFWRNAGFDVIRNIPHLHEYTARYDPTVIPVVPDTVTADALPAPTQRRAGPTAYYTSADYHALYKAGSLSPVAVVEALLPLIRCDATPAGAHSVAFLESNVARVRAAAEASAQRYRDGTPLGPLDGVPVAVKDELNMEGYKRTLGSKLDFTNGVDGTSWCVKKWEEAGAIVVGKTTMHELGLGESRSKEDRRSTSPQNHLYLETKLTQQIPTTTTPTTARRATRTTRSTTAAARRAGRATPSPQGWCPSRSARTAAAQSASRRRSAASGG